MHICIYIYMQKLRRPDSQQIQTQIESICLHFEFLDSGRQSLDYKIYNGENVFIEMRRLLARLYYAV